MKTVRSWLPMFDAYGIPAIEMAGYHCLMPTASAMQNLRNLNYKTIINKAP